MFIEARCKMKTNVWWGTALRRLDTNRWRRPSRWGNGRVRKFRHENAETASTCSALFIYRRRRVATDIRRGKTLAENCHCLDRRRKKQGKQQKNKDRARKRGGPVARLHLRTRAARPRFQPLGAHFFRGVRAFFSEGAFVHFAKLSFVHSCFRPFEIPISSLCNFNNIKTDSTFLVTKYCSNFFRLGNFVFYRFVIFYFNLF